MQKLSIVSHYYNHPHMVERQIAYWESLPSTLLKVIEFVLIDDCSEQRPTLRATHLNLRVFRIQTEIDWNQSGARNLGAYLARGEWALFMDIDQHFYGEPILAVVEHLHTLDKTTMYHLKIRELLNILTNNRLQFAPSTFLVHLPTYKRLGLYDEDFAGHYGYEDLYAHQVWMRNGGQRMLLNDSVYFEDIGFGTTTLNRDNNRNNMLSRHKMATGAKNSPSILRFDWEQLAIPTE